MQSGGQCSGSGQEGAEELALPGATEASLPSPETVQAPELQAPVAGDGSKGGGAEVEEEGRGDRDGSRWRKGRKRWLGQAWSRSSSVGTEESAPEGRLSSSDEGSDEEKGIWGASWRRPNAQNQAGCTGSFGPQFGSSQGSMEAPRTPSSSNSMFARVASAASAGRSFRRSKGKSEDVQKRDQQVQTSTAELGFVEEGQTPLEQCLRQICEAMDFAYAEVWVRSVPSRSSFGVRKSASLKSVLKDDPSRNQFVTDGDEQSDVEDPEVPGPRLDPSDEDGRKSAAMQLRGGSLKTTSVANPFSKKNRVRSFPPRRQSVDTQNTEGDKLEVESEAGDKHRGARSPRSSMAGTDREQRTNGRAGSMDTGSRSSDPPPKVQYGNTLVFGGHTFANPRHVSNGGKNEVLHQMITMAANVSYERGEGYPGLAWNRVGVDWHDLGELNLDDEDAADQRNICAKGLFEYCVGVPVLDDDNDVVAVLMLYKVGGGGFFDVQKFVEDETNQYLLESGAEFVHASLLMQQRQNEFVKVFQKKEESHDYQSGAEENQDLLAGGSFFQSLWVRFSQYLHKFRGQNATPPGGHDLKYVSVTFIGVFLAVLLVSGLDRILIEEAKFKDDQLFLMIGSMGAVATMLFSTPHSPLAQPRTVIGGHLISAAVALCLDYLTSPDYWAIVPQWIANAMAPALAASAMTYTGFIHPPAGACALIYISGGQRIKNLGWLFLAVPILLDAVLMIGLALVLNNLAAKRRYPLFW